MNFRMQVIVITSYSFIIQLFYILEQLVSYLQQIQRKPVVLCCKQQMYFIQLFCILEQLVSYLQQIQRKLVVLCCKQQMYFLCSYFTFCSNYSLLFVAYTTILAVNSKKTCCSMLKITHVTAVNFTYCSNYSFLFGANTTKFGVNSKKTCCSML